MPKKFIIREIGGLARSACYKLWNVCCLW